MPNFDFAFGRKKVIMQKNFVFDEQVEHALGYSNPIQDAP
jgi:hypothetical protein